MAEKSFGWANNGTGDGAAVSVVDSAELLKAIVGGAGVVRGYLNELAPTASAPNVLINTGWGVGVTGHLYRNSTSLTVPIATPGSGTTGHSIVLREDLAAQTVRVYDIASADGTSSIPAATSEDKMLATLTITTGGAITLTDVREFAGIGLVVGKYKTAAQTISATTTYADVSASAGNLSLLVAPSEVWYVEWGLFMTFSDVGGLKLEVAGPSSPTSVRLAAQYARYFTNSDVVLATQMPAPITAFSTNIFSIANNNTGPATNGTFDSTGLIIVRGLIANGANAGAVTLRAAQNTAAGSAAIGIGSYMRAERIA